jgi:hypothetical protein
MRALRDALDARAIGQPDAVTGLLLGLVAREHVWLEGPTGCGKTRLAEAVGPLCSARVARLDPERRMSLLRTVDGDRERIEREVAEPTDPEIILLDEPGEDVAARVAGLAHGVMAIATARPGATAPDVFAVQVRMRPLLLSGDFDSARRVIEAPPIEASTSVLRADRRRAAQDEAARLPVTMQARDALRDTLARLRDRVPEQSLSDRTFGRAALRLMRAHAWLRGAPRVEAADVEALRYTLAGRFPEALDPGVAGVGDATSVAGAGVRAAAGGGGPGASDEPVPAPIDAPLSDAAAPHAPDAEIASLVEALAGRMGRGRASRREDPAGPPRSWRGLRGLEEVVEADPAEAWLWATGRAPEAPRVPRRERRDRGGAVALLRDVSASMEGRLGAWAGEVVSALAVLGRRRNMQLGYVEFNHAAYRFSHARRFFHARYDAVAALGARRRSEGRTSYQAPLALALDELRRTAFGERHVVLLTDGVPVVGDPEVRAERALARSLGVRVHTVFLGTGPRPAVLDRLALETGGLGFRAHPRAGRGISVEVACTRA